MRLVDEIYGELGMIESVVGKVCLERKEMNQQFENVSRHFG